MSSIKIGLNLPTNKNKSKLASCPPQRPPRPSAKAQKLAAFADHDEEDENEDDSFGGGVFGKGMQARATGGAPSKTKNKDNSKKAVNVQLETYAALSKTAEEQASTGLDPSVYDYDAAYDLMKSVGSLKAKKAEQEALERKPKYMENLLVAAEIRKRDQLIAKEKLLAKEREAEGEEYKDKEKFVTEAYKKQQEENRRIEEEEKRREEEERAKSQGLTTFFRNILDKNESKHEELVKAAASGQKTAVSKEVDGDKEKSAEEVAKEINAIKAGAVELNEEGQVVDKRQLLSAGLNLVTPKNSDHATRVDTLRSNQYNRYDSGRAGRSAKEDTRARQSRMIEEQLEQAQKRAREEEEKEKEEVAKRMKSTKTAADLQSARERYLARKKAAEVKSKDGDML